MGDGDVIYTRVFALVSDVPVPVYLFMQYISL